ncbi:MAG: DUF3604 domain-containing protein [Pseudomonadota bacterium]
MSRIPGSIMGDVWPAVLPGATDADYGSAHLSSAGPFPARSLQTLRLTYTAGEFGLDDTGAIKIVQRWTQDGGPFQFDDPTAANYVTARASNGVALDLHQEPYPHQRPWYAGFRVTVTRGNMAPGDTITMTLGDVDGGGPGLRLQTFCEKRFEFVVLADPCATGVFLPVGTTGFEIEGGPAETWVLTAPTLRRPSEPFSLGLRAEDRWGNATGDHVDKLKLAPCDGIDGLPDTVRFPRGKRGLRIEGLVAERPGTYRFELLSDTGDRLAVSNPLVIAEGDIAAYWGDLHGQSGETVGIDTIEEYMTFARDIAFLDVTSHQANDFQLTNAFWDQINAVTAAFDDPGQFTVFPGYEWSANTPLGGDHNVFFRHEGEQIHRSSHALLEDRSDLASDAPTLEELFHKLEGRDCVIYAHIGGRPADIARADAPKLRRSVELHSDWGTFEWLLFDAFALGHRVGVVCNSDGHKGAPGACYPGASEFGAYSGLTCFLATELTRDAIFDAMRARRHFGTTGCRMHIDLTAAIGPSGRVFADDPRWSEAPPIPAEIAQIGDIITSDETEVAIDFHVTAQAPIERIDVFSGSEIIKTHRPFQTSELGNRIRVVWQGAAYRGRGRQTHWHGDLTIGGGRINRMASFNLWNHDRPTGLVDAHKLGFDIVTTGNFAGVDLWVDPGADADIRIECPVVQAKVPIGSLGLEDIVVDAGGLDRKIRLFRLPETLSDRQMSRRTYIPRNKDGRDTPIWIRVTTEDGHRAWTSPIYWI